MARTKAFGSRVAQQGDEPMRMEINDQVFLVNPTLAGVRLLRLIKAMDAANEEDNSATEMLSFIESAVVPSDRARCMQYLLDSDPPIELGTLTEIITWLIEEYSGKNSKSSPSSVTGSETSTSTSTGEPYSAESTSNPNGSAPQPISAFATPFSATP